ncbi:MAG: hypothetical protein AAF293_00230 [Pseudomonadota bacterium]
MLDFDPNSVGFDDFPALAPLEQIANDLRINLTLFGGAASRAIMHKLAQSPDEKSTLFDLAPFSSDFDLSHDGDNEVSARLKRRITEDIPFSSWFRWSVLDGEASQTARAARASSTTVALRRIEIGNLGNSRVPPQAIDDISRRVVSCKRNPAYEDSDLARKGRDVEFFGFLLALNALMDLREILGDGQLEPGVGDVSGWLSPQSITRQLSLFESNPLLARRLWNLLANLFARTGQDLIKEFPALGLIVELAGAVSEIPPILEAHLIAQQGLSASRVTAAGVYRVSDRTPKILTGAQAQDFTEQFLRQLPAGRDPEDGEAPIRLDPAFELIAVVPVVTVEPYVYESSDREDHDPFFSGADEEFLEIAWLPEVAQPLHANGITACMIPYPGAFSMPYTFDVPAVGGVFAGNRPWVRIRLDDLIQHGPDGKALKVAILVLQASPEVVT